MIKVQREDFDIGAELAQLTDGNTKVGGLASFVGLVRDLADQGAVSAMTLEHYPGMTEKRLAEIEAEARARWPLESVADHPPLRQAGARRPHRAGRHHLVASPGRARSRARS